MGKGATFIIILILVSKNLLLVGLIFKFSIIFKNY